MKKRIIAFFMLLVMTISISSVYFVYADTYYTQEAVEVLQKLNVLTAEEVENAGDTAVTRAEFAVYAAKAMQFESVPGEIYFKDMPLSHWANGYITPLVMCGSVSKAEDGLFHPEDTVTPMQAYKIMLAGIGYAGLAGNGTLEEYLQVANRSKIAIPTASQEQLTLKEAAEIIYQAMNLGVANLSVSGDGFVARTINKDETLLRYFNVYREIGIISAVYGVSTSDELWVENEKEVYIDNTKYAVEQGVKPQNYFAQKKEFLYQKGRDGERTLIYIVGDANESLKISSKLLVSVDETRKNVEYYKDENATQTRNIAISNTMTVIYNGKPFYGDVYDVLRSFVSGEKVGYAEFIKSTGMSYDTLIIKSYRTMIAKQYNSKDEEFIDYYDSSNNLKIKQYDTVAYWNEDGEKSVAPNAFPVVLEIAETEDASYAEIMVYSTTITGSIEQTYHAEKEIVIEGTTYTAKEQVWKEVVSHLALGTKVDVLLGMYGEIAFVEVQGSDAMTVGYVIKAAAPEKVFGNSVIFQVFAENEIKDIQLADKVKLDGKNYDLSKGIRDFFLHFPDTIKIESNAVSLKPQIIRFVLNGDGEIAEIDSMKVGENEDAKHTLTRKYDGSQAIIYNSLSQRFGMDVMYNPSTTKMFVVPTVDENGYITVNGEKVSPTEDMYGTSIALAIDYTYNLENYNYNSANPFDDVLVIHAQPSNEVLNVYMFDSYEERLNEKFEATTTIKCFAQEGEVSLTIDESYDIAKIPELKKGDIFKVTNGYTNKTVTEVVKMFDAETKTFLNDGTNPYWYAGTFSPLGTWNYRGEKWQLSKSYVYDINASVMSSCYEPSDLVDGNTSEKVNTSGMSIIVYDPDVTRGEMIYKGNIAEVQAYTNYGFDCSLILVATNQAVFKCIFVYK